MKVRANIVKAVFLLPAAIVSVLLIASGANMLRDSTLQVIAQIPAGGPQRPTTATMPPGACWVDRSFCDRCENLPNGALGGRIRLLDGEVYICCTPDAIAHGDDEHCFVGAPTTSYQPASDATSPATAAN